MACIHSRTGLNSKPVILRSTHLARLMVVVVVSALSGCGGNDLEITPITDEADIILFQRGDTALEEGDWSRGRQYFEQIRDNYPQSLLRADARIRIVESYEGEENAIAYTAALTELREFLRLYPPTHELAPVAQFKVGLVYFNQMRRPERDQSETRAAISELETFVAEYASIADAELLSEARAKLREARDRLSESSFIVGRFYYRNKYWSGAIDRFRGVLDEDPGYTRRDAIYYHLADSLAESDRAAEALPMFERLVGEFPETEYLEEASARIAELKLAMDLEDR